MRLRFLILLLFLTPLASSEDGAPRVDSISFFAGHSPLVFWTPGLSERVLVRTHLAGGGVEGSAHVVLRAEWGLLAAGTPLRDDRIAWSAAEDLAAFDVEVGSGSAAEVFTTVRMARHAREWRDRGMDVVRCRVLVQVGDGAPSSGTLEVIPAER